jgi:hypothetical protein
LIDDYYVNLVIKILLTVMAFTIAVNTGRIKIYQYQESLEDYIRIKQEWIQFAVNIAAELQLPIDLRQDALYIIENYKGKYLDLLKAESEISERVKDRIKKMMEMDDVKFNQLIQKYNYIMDLMEEDKDVDVNKIIQEFDLQHHPEQPMVKKTSFTRMKSKREISEREVVNRMVKNFLNGNQVSVYGVKISSLILNLVFKEKFDLNILQRQDFYDTDIDLIILYDKLSMNNSSKIPESAHSSERDRSEPERRSDKKTHMPKLISKPTKAKVIPRSDTSTQVSEVNDMTGVNDISTNIKITDPEIRIDIDPSK